MKKKKKGNKKLMMMAKTGYGLSSRRAVAIAPVICPASLSAASHHAASSLPVIKEGLGPVFQYDRQRGRSRFTQT
jgi:hypothetical protein